ncbi:MAG: hypothetical protein ACOCZK_01385 [Planctomycetota bacterium]
MKSTPLLVLCLLAGAPLCTAEDAGPWDAVWTMTLRGEERTYVDYAGTSYLRLRDSDFAQPDFLDNKDVAVKAKFNRIADKRPLFYDLEDVHVTGGAAMWGTTTNGDNYWILGTMKRKQDGLVLEAIHKAEAPSDASIIEARLTDVPADDFAARLAVATWVREQAEGKGNTTFWLDTARTIIRNVVARAASQAAEAKNFDLLLSAMGWAVERLDAPDLAAELGSADWAREKTADNGSQKGPADIEAMMSRLGYVYHTDEEFTGWLPVAESLTREFEQRFAALDWRNAQGFYKLGRWVDRHADLLPNARQLAHRAFTQGLQADPDNNDIRLALGMDPVAKSSAAPPTQRPYVDDETGVVVKGPEMWYRNAKPIDRSADATWYDPNSVTAYIAVHVEPTSSTGEALADIWRRNLEDIAQVRPQFAIVEETQPVDYAGFEGWKTTYSYKESDYRRLATAVLLRRTEGAGYVRLTALYVDDEQNDALAALEQTIGKTMIPQREAEADDLFGLDDSDAQPERESDEDAAQAEDDTQTDTGSQRQGPVEPPPEPQPEPDLTGEDF